MIAARRAGKVFAHERVFLSSRGRAGWDHRKAWARAIERAGLGDRDRLTRHALRHTFAVHFLEGGAAITDLQVLAAVRKRASTAT